MRLGCCALLALSACYAPKIVGGVPCDPSDVESCPLGQTCVPSGGSGVCSEVRLADAGPGPGSDASIDGRGSDASGMFCLGANLIGSLCFPTAPTMTVRVAATTTINTASTNSGNCTEIRPQPGGQSLCVLSGATIEIAVGATLRAIGPNPLVLFAARTISVGGTLDVASRAGETVGNTPVLGAGARSATDCNAIGLDGKPSDGGNQGSNAGGGGAGGSFGGLGGPGGTGRGNIRGGVAVLGAIPPLLTGGCPGGNGGDGTDGGGGGVGGGGGGAVYLLAGESIMAGGTINASGAGGSPGVSGVTSSGAGAGGGAGGMIGLEAPHVAATGALFANGGGGGGGAGFNFGDQGAPGKDPVAALTPAPGGPGNNGGGSGGAGSAVPKTGAAASNSTKDNSGGGGGGGGGGVIRVFGDPAPALTTVSPPPS